jgi:EAL domain-containing protein (putative c-di-GMP-specific phosphodiesterase class I)
LQSGRITEAEALLRWQRANGEMLSPKDFIPLAEDMGIIVRMGEWVLRTVCKQNKAWQQAGLPPVRVSVNLSVRQLKQQGFVDSVQRVLAETGLEARWLEFELTESALMETIDAAPTTLAELAEMGVRLSIDDFGNGSSSLSSLQRVCFDTLKISRTFIADMLHDQKASALVKSMINLAHSLDISVTATGVESRDQLSFLLRERCDKIQGYVASRPVPPERFAELLRADRRLLAGQAAVSAADRQGESQSAETRVGPVAVNAQPRTDLEELATALCFTDEHSR